jgi:hypothetical protein
MSSNSLADQPKPTFPRVTRRRVFRTFLVLLLVSLSVLATFLLQKWRTNTVMGTPPQVFSGPWGDLQVWNVSLEQPSEYVAFESTTSQGPLWNFGPISLNDLQSLLLKCGCTSAQAQSLLASQVPANDGVKVIKPAESAILELGAQTRSELYLALAKLPGNRFQTAPYLIPEDGLARMATRKFQRPGEVVKLMEKLVYFRNGYTYFSDPQVVLGHLKAEERLEFFKALTSLDVVMARILLKPDSNIDTPAIYWSLTMNGVMIKDLRTIFEAQKQLPDGSSVSIMYVLPPLAREHLYTTPLPPENGEKLPDCHWTALNYFNATPDPKLSDTTYATQYLAENYYQIGQPSLAGDLVLLLDSQNKVIHSSVYLAADIVFTKNGINLGQPWVLMHEKDMIGLFSALEPAKPIYMRRKDR